MDHQEENETISHGDQAEIDPPDVISDLVLDTVVPAPVRRNFTKAFSRLSSAAIDIPIAFLEGKAQEIRALTEERKRLIHTTSDQISEQMRVDPEYARRAVAQFGNKVLREQVNLDSIVEKSGENLKQGGDVADQAASEAEIDDDWLEHFDTEARKKSTPEMQEYFARLLAGEINKPNSFSIKTVRMLGTMDNASATLFQRFCSMCVVLRNVHPDRTPFDARIIALAGDAAQNALQKYGLPFDALNMLHEYGLIISDYNSWRDYQVCCPRSIPATDKTQAHLFVLPFSFQSRSWILLPMRDDQRITELKLNGVALTRSGMELMSIVELEEATEYSKDIIEFFKQRQLLMTETNNPEPQIWQPPDQS